MKKAILYFSGWLLLHSCTASRNLSVTDTDLAVGTRRIPGITANELQQGYKLYVNRCGGCHGLHSPSEYTANQWQPILTEMMGKARLTDELQKKLLQNYIIAKAK